MDTETHPADWTALGCDFYAKGDIAQAETCFRAALHDNRDSPEAWTNFGLSRAATGDRATALACHREALRLNPNFADAHNNLGMCHFAQGWLAEAANCFREALRLRPDFPNAGINLGVVHHALGDLTAAEAAYRAAPASKDALNNLGQVLVEQHRIEEAEAVLRSCPTSAYATVNLSMILLLTGRYREGWRAYEARWAVDSTLSVTGSHGLPRWTGEQSLIGKTILLHAEQGFGDTLQFCRYVPMVTALGARAILAVQPALVRLLTSLPGGAEVIAEGGPVPPADYECPLLSLPLALGTILATIPAGTPYLTADPAQWAERFAGIARRRIGLVWAGSSRLHHPHAAAVNRRRSMDAALLRPLLDMPGCAFVSLQLDQSGQLGQPALLPGLHDWTADLRDFADTAGLIANLDLVIAVDTAVAHLAGALGKPVWLLSRHDGCWRWLRDRDDSPWYPGMRLFRQEQAGDWSGVIARVTEALVTEALAKTASG